MKKMKFAVLGTGDVGKVLATGLIDLGHEVMMGSREANQPKAVDWAKKAGPNASQGNFTDAAKFADAVVLACLGSAAEQVIHLAKPENLRGKLLMDTTNPLAFTDGKPPTLFVGTTDSLGERIQRLAPDAHVVKAFNTVGNPLMVKPRFEQGRPDMFICGNNSESKKRVTSICEAWDWGTVDLGGIEASRYLEPLCMTWLAYGFNHGAWNHAFKLLRS